MEDAPVGSPMQLRDPSEGLGRKAFTHTEAVKTDQCWIEDATVGLTHASEGPFRRTWKKGLRQHRGCTDRLYAGQCFMEDIPVGSSMQLRDPSEGLKRKSFLHTEAVQTDCT